MQGMSSRILGTQEAMTKGSTHPLGTAIRCRGALAHHLSPAVGLDGAWVPSVGTPYESSLCEPPLPAPHRHSALGPDRSQVNRLMWWSPRAAAARIGLCGWNAVAEMGAPRFCCKKFEYGSSRDSSVPSKLNTLTTCAEVPLHNPLLAGPFQLRDYQHLGYPSVRDFCKLTPRRRGDARACSLSEAYLESSGMTVAACPSVCPTP